jgi:HK97 gp10 family phage protein
MISVSFDFSRLARKLDRVVQVVTQGARPAAQAGAQVFYDEVKQRASTVGSDGSPSAPGEGPHVQSGTLRDAVYQAYSEDDSGLFKAGYRISWNKKKAPHGQLLESGTSRMAARPFLRPSYDAKRRAAIEAVNAKLAKEVKSELK